MISKELDFIYLKFERILLVPELCLFIVSKVLFVYSENGEANKVFRIVLLIRIIPLIRIVLLISCVIEF